MVNFSVIMEASEKLKTEEFKDRRVRVIGRVIEINMGDEELVTFWGGRERARAVTVSN